MKLLLTLAGGALAGLVLRYCILHQHLSLGEICARLLKGAMFL